MNTAKRVLLILFSPTLIGWRRTSKNGRSQHMANWLTVFLGITSASIQPDPNAPDPHANPNTTMIQIANGGGLHPARNVVGGDFLHLVRFGIRDANDPIVRDSIEVIDRVLKHDLPQGPGWRRYNHDGYGQAEERGAFDGTGVGRCW